jgi:hypothetical protein
LLNATYERTDMSKLTGKFLLLLLKEAPKMAKCCNVKKAAFLGPSSTRKVEEPLVRRSVFGLTACKLQLLR